MRAKMLAFVSVTSVFAFFTSTSAASAAAVWTEKPKGAPLLATVPDFRELVKQSISSVVNISVEQKAAKLSRRGPGEPMDPNDFFERFFGGGGGGPQRVPRQGQGVGSGFVISADGYVLTNSHVVENAEKIRVKFPEDSGGDEYAAKVIGSDPRTDVALLKIEGTKTNFPLLPLGNSAELAVGDWVLAIGNPFGLAHSVSAGIVSAKDRRDVRPGGRQGLYDFIQTDASINPGNSGGPLLNMRGEVVGINAAINAAGQGLGFAIPVNMIKSVVTDLKDKGRVSRSWLGVIIQGMDQKLAKTFGLDKPHGALIAEVVDGGPSAKAGIVAGDVILEFDGKPVRESTELPLLASQAGVGRAVPVLLLREGKRQTLKVTLGEMPSGEQLASNDPEGNGPSLGITVSEVTPELQQRYEIKDKAGVVITAVEPGSAAEEAELRPGDVIVKLDGKAVTQRKQFVQAVKDTKSGEVLRFLVKRGGSALFVALPKP